jgi:glycosyltransferase involved in cell wall biosynthesis
VTNRLQRLLTLFCTARFGGAEAHTLRLCGAAEAAGVALTLAAEPALHPQLRHPGRRLIAAPLAWRRGLVEVARHAQAEAVREALADARADAVLLPLPWPDQGGGAMEALAEAGIPTLVVAHLAPKGEETPPGLDDGTLDAAARMRASWVAVSAPTAARVARFLRFSEGRIATIPNGVDPAPRLDRAALRAALRERLAVAPDAPIAMFLGRLDTAKGADLLPPLAAAFARRTGGVLACAGDGVLRESLEAAAPSGHALRLLGQQPRPAELLAAADALILPSRLEGAPLTFLEAAWARLPVVSTAAALEALGPDAGAFAALAEEEDVGAMADALAAIVTDPASAASRTEAAWRLAVTWDADAMAARYLARLRALISTPLGGVEAG